MIVPYLYPNRRNIEYIQRVQDCHNYSHIELSENKDDKMTENISKDLSLIIHYFSTDFTFLGWSKMDFDPLKSQALFSHS